MYEHYTREYEALERARQRRLEAAAERALDGIRARRHRRGRRHASLAKLEPTATRSP